MRTPHPVAEIFPAMSDEDHKGLVQDIRENGLREAIWLHRDGRIIDGRNRYRACGIVGIEPAFRTYEGEDASLLSFVVSLNLRRRHLTESQRAMVASRIANMTRGGARSEQTANLPIEGLPAAPPRVTNADAAKLLSVSERSVRSARIVHERATPEVSAAVESGEITVSTAAKLADAPPAEQREVIALAKPERAKKIKEIDARRAAARDLDAKVEQAAAAGRIPIATKRRYDEAAERAERERLRGEFESAIESAAKKVFAPYSPDEVAAFADANLVQSLRLFVAEAKLFLERVESAANPSKPDPTQRPKLRAV